MTFQDDPETTVSGHINTVNDAFDTISVRFQMRRTEFDLIQDGLKADLISFMEWMAAAADKE